tara:strand:- start:3897 stop:4856 length:960 start_codon:yes stop_codon:yes gene_type:complete
MNFKPLYLPFIRLSRILFYITSSLFITSCDINYETEVKALGKDKPIALATFTILSDLAENVAGDRLIIKSITKPGSEIHGYQITPSDLVKARNADLIIENGLGLELWINKFTATAGNIPRVTLSDGIKPLLIEDDTYAGKPNPHVWMSPVRTIHYVDKLVNAFSKIDPEGKDQFIENANKYKKKLLQLDEEFRVSLSSIPLEKRILVSCEGAFSYLAKDYGLKEAYLWPVNAESQVTPKRMANLIVKINKSKVPTIFCETTVSSRAQLEVAKATGVAFGGNFFVDSLSSSEGPASTLLDLQRYNLELIKKGLASETPHK